MAYDLAQTPEQKAKKALVKKAEAEAALLLAKENDKKLKKAMEQRIRKQMEKQKADDELNLNLGKSVKDDCEDAKETREKNKEQLQLDANAFGEKADIKQFEKRTEKKKTPNKRFTVTMNEMESDYFAHRKGSFMGLSDPYGSASYHEHLEEQFPVWLKASGNTAYDAFVKEKEKLKAEAKEKEEAEEAEATMRGFNYVRLAEAARQYKCDEEEEEALMKLDSLVERLGESATEWDWLSPDAFRNRVWFFNPYEGYDLEELRVALEEMEERLKEVESQSGVSVMDEGEEVSELGSVGGSSVGSLGLSGLSADAPNGPADAEVTTPTPSPLSYPKPPGRVPKGKVWNGATGHWVDIFVCNQGEEGEAEESGDAKRAKLAVTES